MYPEASIPESRQQAAGSPSPPPTAVPPASVFAACNPDCASFAMAQIGWFLDSRRVKGRIFWGPAFGEGVIHGGR